jgi:serine protease
VACQPPTNSDQLQCYCTSTTCGAGMLDAGAAVRASLGAQVVIGVSPAAPQAGQTITLSASGSTVASGRSIAGYQWSLVDGGGIVTTIAGANTATATVQPPAGGSFAVRLVVTDDRGVAVAAQQSVTVAAAAAAAGGGRGGGALSAAWLAALASAAALLALWRPARMAR